MYTTVLFDIDGVMLSEERYFDASALTVHELLTSPRFMGIASTSPFSLTPTDADISRIRNQVFDNDRALELLKNVGVNANWDMVYLMFVSELHALWSIIHRLDNADFSSVVEQTLADGWTSSSIYRLGRVFREAQPDIHVGGAGYTPLYGAATSREELFSLARAALTELSHRPLDDRDLWNVCQSTFQEWYLGDEYAGATIGKSGFLASEYPIVDPAEFQSFLVHLQGLGVEMGIATGRPNIETRIPLTHFGWWGVFDPNRVSTASEVLDAEKLVPASAPLSKPHPYSYLRSLTGIHQPDVLLSTDLPMPGIKEQVLIIGDSIADFLAAQRLGASFAAVLTGLEGQLARPKFEELGADYIFDNVLDARQLF